jgi:hypothetical protein
MRRYRRAQFARTQRVCSARGGRRGFDFRAEKRTATGAVPCHSVADICQLERHASEVQGLEGAGRLQCTQRKVRSWGTPVSRTMATRRAALVFETTQYP